MILSANTLKKKKIGANANIATRNVNGITISSDWNSSKCLLRTLRASNYRSADLNEIQLFHFMSRYICFDFWCFFFFLLEIDCSNKNYREFDCIEFFQYYHNRRSPDVQIVYHLHVSSLSFIMQLSEHLLCKYPKNPLHKYSFRKSFSASSVTCSVNNIGILKLKWGNKIAK